MACPSTTPVMPLESCARLGTFCTALEPAALHWSPLYRSGTLCTSVEHVPCTALALLAALGNAALGNAALRHAALGNAALGNAALGNAALGNAALGNRCSA
eukprot:366233-Chlamydomonas_euryale.AAC.2